MKKAILIFTTLLFFMFSMSPMAFGGGDQNHSTKGKGETSTGTSSQGTAAQDRTGR
jgi:hypothetical protein